MTYDSCLVLRASGLGNQCFGATEEAEAESRKGKEGNATEANAGEGGRTDMRNTQGVYYSHQCVTHHRNGDG